MKACIRCGASGPGVRFHKSGRGRRADCTKCSAADQRLRKYGVDADQYATLMEGQKWCGICGKEEDLVIDHCHHTGEVRGILCRQHNRAIGLLGDCPTLLANAQRWVDPEIPNEAQRLLREP